MQKIRRATVFDHWWYHVGLSCYSYLFWSDGTNGNAKIERSDLSGQNRTVLVSAAQGLVSPTTLVVDFSSQKLYWLDSTAEKIGHVNFDGSQPFTKTISGLSHMSAMTAYRMRTKLLEVATMSTSNKLLAPVISMMLFLLLPLNLRKVWSLFNRLATVTYFVLQSPQKINMPCRRSIKKQQSLFSLASPNFWNQLSYFSQHYCNLLFTQLLHFAHAGNSSSFPPFLQGVGMACYAEPCISCVWVVRLSVCHTLALCQNDLS